MKYGFDNGIWGNIFGVPVIIADNFLRLATESQIKVILFLLRNNGNTYDVEEIAKSTGVSTDAVSDAVIFWQQANILPENITSSENTVKSIFTAPPQTSDTVVQEPVQQKIVSSTQMKIDPSEITAMKQSCKELKELFDVLEKNRGVLVFTVQRSIIWMYDYLGLNPDVILMLMNYCSSINKSNVGYVDAIAFSWSENGINDFETAQAEVNRMKESFEYVSKIKRLFEMKRNPTTSQKEYISEWRKAGYSDELLKYAYERTIENTEKLSFSYINSILVSWKKDGISTLEEAKQSVMNFKNKRNFEKGSSDEEKKKSKEEEFEEKYKVFLNKF